MKHLIAMLLLLLACGAPTEESPVDDQNEPVEDEIELGTAEQAVNAQCLGSSVYGAKFDNALPGIVGQCDNMSSGSCFFPAHRDNTAESGQPLPFSVSMRNGWSAADRGTSFGTSAGTNTRLLWDSMFSSWRMNLAGVPNFTFTNQNVTSKDVYLDKGALSGSAGTGDTTAISNILRFSCDNPIVLSESRPGSAVRCSKWSITVDFAKLTSWATGGTCAGSSSQRKVFAYQNTMRKIFLVPTGYGFHGFSGAQGFTVNDISRCAATDFWDPIQEQNWANNYGTTGRDQVNTLTCVN